jgi:hypothetical protein
LSGRFVDFFAAAATTSYVCSTLIPVIPALSFFADERRELAGQRPSAERLKSTLSILAVTPCERMTKGVE